jgi:hypothetical protein
VGPKAEWPCDPGPPQSSEGATTRQELRHPTLTTTTRTENWSAKPRPRPGPRVGGTPTPGARHEDEEERLLGEADAIVLEDFVLEVIEHSPEV